MTPNTLSQTAVSPAVATVLLVDDEPVSRLSMAARLKRMGLRVLEAGNGREGLAILRRLQQGTDLPGIVASLSEEFEVDILAAERDVIEFANLLRNTFR